MEEIALKKISILLLSITIIGILFIGCENKKRVVVEKFESYSEVNKKEEKPK